MMVVWNSSGSGCGLHSSASQQVRLSLQLAQIQRSVTYFPVSPRINGSSRASTLKGLVMNPSTKARRPQPPINHRTHLASFSSIPYSPRMEGTQSVGIKALRWTTLFDKADIHEWLTDTGWSKCRQWVGAWRSCNGALLPESVMGSPVPLTIGLPLAHNPSHDTTDAYCAWIALVWPTPIRWVAHPQLVNICSHCLPANHTPHMDCWQFIFCCCVINIDFIVHFSLP